MDDIIINLGKCYSHCPIHSSIEGITMKLSELANQLTAIDAKLTEASSEITTKIDALQAALENVDIPDDAVELINEISTKAAALADIVPNE